MEFLLIYVLPVFLFFKLTSKQQREDWAMYFWVFVILFGAGGFLFELFKTGSIPAPCCLS